MRVRKGGEGRRGKDEEDEEDEEDGGRKYKSNKIRGKEGGGRKG